MALLESALFFTWKHLPLISSFLLVIYFLRNRYRHGLVQYPGPFLAQFTDLWRFFDVWGRRPELTHQRLHKQHGDIVRLGPNLLSFADPKAVKDIYGLNKGYIKQAFSKGQRLPTLFSTVDEQYHAQLRRCVNSAFSMSALVQYEPGVDVVTELFLKRTKELYVKPRKICDFTQWLQYYAFDGIGQITYSKPHGFLERDEDVDGIVSFLRATFDYVAPIGQLPWLDLVLVKNPILGLLDRYGILPAPKGVVSFAKENLKERLDLMNQEIDVEKTPAVSQQSDLLSKFLKAKEDHPDFFHDGRVLSMALSMAFAGSETTAITLASVFYYLVKNPDKYEKLMAELDSAQENGSIQHRESGVVTWAESRSLPYLDACIKEAFRVHPAVGLLLERVTPPQGAQICGTFVPGGTLVGCSAWLIHRRPEIFGEDVDSFRPERWLECDAASLKEMEGTLFQFGAGARTCIGKNISLLEIYKLVPSFLIRFRVSLADPGKSWTPHNAWFVRQKDFSTRFELRDREKV